MVAGDRAGMQLARPATARLLAAKRIVELPTTTREAQLALVARDGQLQPDDGGDRGRPASRASSVRVWAAAFDRRTAPYRPAWSVTASAGMPSTRRPGDQLLGMAGPVKEAEVGVRVELAVVVRHAHWTTNDRTVVLICQALYHAGMGQMNTICRPQRWRANAYLAPARPAPGPPVLLLHPWWGLNQTIRDLADRLAGDGFTVIAPDMFDGTVLDHARRRHREHPIAHGGRRSARSGRVSLPRSTISWPTPTPVVTVPRSSA